MNVSYQIPLDPSLPFDRELEVAGARQPAPVESIFRYSLSRIFHDQTSHLGPLG